LAMGFCWSHSFSCLTFCNTPISQLDSFFCSAPCCSYTPNLNGLTNTNVQHRGLYALAGFSAGCAALTKNEGLLFLLVFVAAWFLQVLLRESPGKSSERAWFSLRPQASSSCLSAFTRPRPHERADRDAKHRKLSKIIQASRHEAILASFAENISDPKSLSLMVRAPTSRWPLFVDSCSCCWWESTRNGSGRLPRPSSGPSLSFFGLGTTSSTSRPVRFEVAPSDFHGTSAGSNLSPHPVGHRPFPATDPRPGPARTPMPRRHPETIAAACAVTGLTAAIPASP